MKIEHYYCSILVYNHKFIQVTWNCVDSRTLEYFLTYVIYCIFRLLHPLVCTYAPVHNPGNLRKQTRLCTFFLKVTRWKNVWPKWPLKLQIQFSPQVFALYGCLLVDIMYYWNEWMVCISLPPSTLHRNIVCAKIFMQIMRAWCVTTGNTLPLHTSLQQLNCTGLIAQKFWILQWQGAVV